MNQLPVLASGHDIEILGFRAGEWVDAETMGRKLGTAFPRQYIIRLFNRHKNGFREDETCEVNLTSQVGGHGKERRHTRRISTRLFSVPRGALRLCILSRAPNAAEVQNEILDLFDKYRFAAML